MKKKFSLLLSCATMILGSLNVFGAVGLIVNNKTYVPVRGVFEELGFNVTYDKENATAIIIDSNFTIKIPKDKTYFFVNSNSISPDSPQKIINGNMYLPLRAIADSIGADISWNSETKIAHVSYKGKDSYISTKTTIPVKSTTSSSSIIDNTTTHPFYFFNGIELGENLDTRDGSEVRQKNRARTNLVTVPYNCTITSTEYSVRVFYYNADGSFKKCEASKNKDLYKGDNVRLVFIPSDGNEITDATTICNDVKITENTCIWYALGDSITQGFYSYTDGDGTETGSSIKVTSDCWANKVAEINNYKLINYGVGGSGFVHNGTVLDKLNAKAHVDTIDFSNADLVTIAFGVNDWKYNMALGSMEDDVATGESLYANMRYVIEKILGDNPSCKIVVITPINCSKWGNENTNYGLGVKFPNNGTLEDIFNAEVEVCKYYGVEYIDMTHSSFINNKNITEILPDGVHPSLEAHKIMGEEIAKKIQYIVK